MAKDLRAIGISSGTKIIACAVRSIPTSLGNYSSIGQTFIRDSEAKIRKTDYQSPLPSVGDIFFRAVSR